MLYSLSGDFSSTWLKAIQTDLQLMMNARAHTQTVEYDQAGLVFHAIDPKRPRPFRRQSQATFVVGLIEQEAGCATSLRALYPLLVRSLSNLVIAGTTLDSTLFLATPELGHYSVSRSQAWWHDALYDRIAPLATSHLVIDNIFDADLPEALWEGTVVTRQMRDASRQVAAWDLFPAPYPVADLLPPQDYRHLKKVFGIGGLSYGNLSARHDAQQFWMSASGVDKGSIGTVSQDILLVKGYDKTTRAMRISVAPEAKPCRVSVDAVEHWGIYRRHPEIGALLHIHAWVDGIPSTSINFPCGTVEMGEAMSRLLDQDEHPERTIIGLRNHGITATGPSFPDILNRLEGRILAQVPMS